MLPDVIEERKVAPAQIGCDDDDAALAIERTRRADADAHEVAPVGLGLGDRIEDHTFDESDDAVGDSLRPELG